MSLSTASQDPSKAIQALGNRIRQGDRLSLDEAQKLYITASDEELMFLATVAKKRFHSEYTATYLKMAIVNYTNICVAKCDYCAFYRLPHQKDTYLLSFDQICEKIDALLTFGGTMVAFNGGFHPGLRLADYAELFAKVKERYPDIGCYSMTVAEFMFACKRSKLSYHQGAQVLLDAGTEWVTGGGAEVLTDSFRSRHSPGKYKVDDYYQAQEALVNSGLGSTATMVIGFDETLAERMLHLKGLRDFQDRVSGKLRSFLCWTYKPDNTDFGGEEISYKEYCRWLAIARIYLDNFVHIRTSVLTQNEFALNALKYGADDFDLPIEDEVTQSAGATISHEFKSILEFAEKIGYNAVLRRPWVAQGLDSKPSSEQVVSS